MNKMKLLFLLLMSVQYSFGQNRSQIDSVFLDEFRKQIYTEIDDSYKNDIFPFIDIEWNLRWIGDINKDGEDDIVLKILRDNIGGGNSWGYFYHVFYMKNNKIIDRDTILGGGKFSPGQLSVDSISNNTIYASLIRNEMYDFSNSDSPVKEVKLQFIWYNGKLYEESYLTCSSMKIIEKGIFKTNSVKTIRKSTLDGLYEEVLQESLKSNDKNIHAEFSGCETFELGFWFIRPCKNKKEFNLSYKKNDVLKEISYLHNITQFDDLIVNVILDIKNNGLVLDTIRYLPNYWSYKLHTYYMEYEGNFSGLVLRFINAYTDKIERDYWKEIQRF